MLTKKKKVILASYLYLTRKKKKKTTWTKAWLGDIQRKHYSFSNNLENSFRANDQQEHKNYCRMDIQTFDELLHMIAPLVTKQDTHFRKAITAREKLGITLSYLSQGLSLMRLSYEYRVGVSTACDVLQETINAIIHVLLPNHMKLPNTEKEWLEIEESFETLWNFPSCFGALDGKHVHVFSPPNSGSYFYNYKNGYSVVLLALVDANYRFLAVDIGANGRCADSGVWENSKIRKSIIENTINLPKPKVLPGSTNITPSVIVADSGFPLESFVMRPYPDKNITKKQRIFNYRLSRARRVTENAFGILSNRWRILLKRMLVSPEKATNITFACCLLHNYLLSKTDSRRNYIGEDRELDINDTLPSLSPSHSRNNFDERKIRDSFADYFSNEGRVEWQDSSIEKL